MSEARAGDASTRVFGTAELVRAIAAHVASQDLAAFRLVNRFAGVYGAPHQFVWHAYPWPKSKSFVRLGSGKEHLRHLRHIVVDTDVDSWQSFGDDFRLSDKRREQWSRLYDLLAAPELTGLETIDLKASICWASQIEGLTQPEFKRDNRLSISLRSLCLTGITEAMDRHWEASLGRPWWNSVSNLIERCIDVQSSLGEVKLRHFHIGVEGDASILCGPPTVGFITTFRASLLGNLESLTLGKLSYDTSRALLGPLGLHPSAELSQQVQYDWPVWTRLQKLRISFGRGADAAASRLCDHVLDHCPVLQELYLTLGLSQPIRLVTTQSKLLHLSIEIPELVLGAHIRGERERNQLEHFVTSQKSLRSLSLNHVEVRDQTSGRHAAKRFSDLPPIQLSAATHPKLRACTGNYVVFAPSEDASIVRWQCQAPQFRHIDWKAKFSSQKHVWTELYALDKAKLTFISMQEFSIKTAPKPIHSSPFTIIDAAEALRDICKEQSFPLLAEIELKGELLADEAEATMPKLLDEVKECILVLSQIPTVQAVLLSPLGASTLSAHIENIVFPPRALGLKLQLLGIGTELFDRVEVSSGLPASTVFRRRTGRHHPLRCRTLIDPQPRLPLWWGESYKLRDVPDVVGFPDPFLSILEHLDAADSQDSGLEDQTAAAAGLPKRRTLPLHRLA